MHFGYYISGFAHLGLLMGLLIGPIFQKDVEPVEYSSVSLISEQEFIDLTASNISPKVSEEASELTPLDENEDKLDLLFNKESEVLKSEGPDVILDEPLEPVIKKPDVEIALTERTPEIADEIKRPVSDTVNNLSDLQTETAEINKPSKVVKPAPITQPEVEVSQTLENTIKSVDKFPCLTDYIIPPSVRIGDASRVRLGAYLSEGTTVMHEGFVNFNAGTLGPAMIEGRISAGVVVGKNSDLGGGCSTMGTLSGGNDVKISIGENCLLGANSGLGIPLGDNCIIEAGLYITGGSKITTYNSNNEKVSVIKASELSGCNNLLFIRNSQSGAIEAKINPKSVALNKTLHKN